MNGRAKLDYSKIDPWIKKHPDNSYADFVSANPKIAVSDWTYRKRRAKVLGLHMPPSMRDDYRGGDGNKDGSIDRRSSRSVYTTVYSAPIKDLKAKNGLEAVSDFIGIMNRIFKLHMESAQVEVIGIGIQNFEIRRYSR